MNSYKRVIIATLSTTLLHASIFYSIPQMNPKKQEVIRYVEIAMIEDIGNNKSEELSKNIGASEKKVEEESKPKEEPKQEEPKLEKKPEPKPKEKIKPIKKKVETPKKEIKEIEKIDNSPIISSNVTSENVSQVETKEQFLPNTQSGESIAESKSLLNKEGGSKVGGSASELALYLAKIRKKIQDNLEYPIMARKLKKEGEVLVEFEILQNGKLKNSSLCIKKTSGHKVLDDKALQTVEMLSPFDRPPQDSLLVAAPILFKLK